MFLALITAPCLLPPAHLCSGTLIWQRIVLTAAHCVYTGPDTAAEVPTWVYFGHQPPNNAESFRPHAAFRHPDYDPHVFDNDIGVVVLFEPIGDVAAIPPSYEDLSVLG